MTNKERLKFLEGKPTYNCRIHPSAGWHESGCPHKEWTKEQLQDALNSSKRSHELRSYLLNNPEK